MAKKDVIVRVVSANTANLTPEQEWQEFESMAKNLGVKITEDDKKKFLRRLAEESAEKQA